MGRSGAWTGRGGRGPGNGPVLPGPDEPDGRNFSAVCREGGSRAVGYPGTAGIEAGQPDGPSAAADGDGGKTGFPGKGSGHGPALRSFPSAQDAAGKYGDVYGASGGSKPLGRGKDAVCPGDPASGGKDAVADEKYAESLPTGAGNSFSEKR